MSFLIVDDNSTMRRVLRRIISEFAGDINDCSDGTDAFADYEHFQPEWVLMDVKMRDKDGLTATREIHTAFPQARIVIVTNYDSEMLRKAAEQAGAIGIVGKENLLELREILDIPELSALTDELLTNDK